MTDKPEDTVLHMTFSSIRDLKLEPGVITAAVEEKLIDKKDVDKPRYDLLPPLAIDDMAKVLTFGAYKYAPENWRNIPNGVERYKAALLRHAFAMLRGEQLDPETGLPHAAHVMCCASFVLELERA